MDLNRFGYSKIYHLLKKFKRKLRPNKHRLEQTDWRLQGNLEKSILEIIPTKANTKIIGANWLIQFKNNQASEHGEDGMITKIFEILKPENKWVCEFGAHDPENISNTWRLINREGWHAVLIEADNYYYDKLKKYYKNSNEVHCIKCMVSYTGENSLDSILQNTPAPRDLDLMIIDIDGNDFHVWESIDHYKAKVVLIEFNASIPNCISYVQPRDLNINRGSSLKAMTELAERKGYKLLAVTSWNAFFIQEAYYPLFFDKEPSIDDMYVYPAKHPIEMRPFQLYDGTIVVAPYDKMLWHRIDLKSNDYQVLPESMRIFSKKRLYKNKANTAALIDKHIEHIKTLTGNVLAKYSNNYFSTYGEDGILEKCITNIYADNQIIVDVGAWDGVNNSRSRHLIYRHHWQGFLIENDPEIIGSLKSHNRLLETKLINQPYALHGENSLDQTFKKYHLPKEFEVLVLNTYGMEYYLWESLQQFSPKIVMVQFNPTIPNDVKFIQAKDFSLHQGVSLQSLCDLAHYKGYELIAVTLETAFFLKRKYFYRFFETDGLKKTDLDEMFCPIEMKLFQLYDGTIALRGLNHLLWHDVSIDEEHLQVVPKALRKFHQFATPDEKKFYRI